MGLFGSSSVKRASKEQARIAREQRADELAFNKRVKEGTEKVNKAFERFDDSFFSGVQDSYRDFARPQLDEQLSTARNDLRYHLARNGLSDSTAWNKGVADLSTQFSRGMQDIASRGSEVAARQRAGLEDARSDLLRGLQASGDADLAIKQANARASIIAQPETFSPLTEIIKAGSAQLGNQLAAEKAAMDYGGRQPTFWTGAYGARPGSTVTRR